jgi:hypothetical protein
MVLYYLHQFVVTHLENRRNVSRQCDKSLLWESLLPLKHLQHLIQRKKLLLIARLVLLKFLETLDHSLSLEVRHLEHVVQTHHLCLAGNQ